MATTYPRRNEYSSCGTLCSFEGPSQGRATLVATANVAIMVSRHFQNTTFVQQPSPS